MNQNTYPDGFPREPLAAIDFSYFLNDGEKQEWRQWLQAADASQQEELVDTLHQMWLDEQQKAVPNGFNMQQPPAQQQMQPEQRPEPGFVIPNAQQNTANTAAPQQKPQQSNNQKPPQVENKKPQAQVQAPQQKPQAPVAQKKESTNEERAKQFGEQKYSANPLLDEGNSSDFSFENHEKREVIEAQKATEAKQSQDHAGQRFLNIKKLRETATKKELEGLYSSYLKSRDSNFKTEQEYVENQAQFLDKVMGIVVNFETVADYYEAMTEKLLEMNNKMVSQARDVQQIKNEYSNKQLSAQDEIDALKDRMDRLEASVRDLRLSTNRKYQEIKDEVSIFEADSLGYDGMSQRFELLESKIGKLERGENGENSSVRDRFNKLQQNRDSENSVTNADKVIDMRDKI